MSDIAGEVTVIALILLLAIGVKLNAVDFLSICAAGLTLIIL